MASWSTVRFAKLTSDLRLDAEYYRPEFLKQDSTFASFDTTPLGTIADVSDGNHLSIAENFCESGIRYLRGQDLSEFFVSDSDPLFIPEKEYASLKRSHMFPGDVLVGIVGTIGTIGLLTKRFSKLTGSCKLAIVRPHSLPAEYIATYLASNLGQNEIKRRIRGALQMGLILPDLRTLPVVQPDKSLLNSVVSLVHEAYEKREHAKRSLESAQNILLDALGLQDVDLTQQKWYSLPSREIVKEQRMDAEYFSPKYQSIITKLRKGERTLLDIATLSDHRFDVSAKTKSSAFRYIEIGSVTEDGEAQTEIVETAHAPSRAVWRVKAGDIITSTVRPIRRLSAIIREDQDGSVCSSGFAVLTPKQGKDGIEAEVLLTFLRLPIICEILDLNTTASMYPAISIPRLMRIPIIVPSERVRRQIVNKVQEGASFRQQSSQLLDNAKKEIEGSILKITGGKAL